MAKNGEKLAQHRLAVINEDLCRPKECALECKRACPVNRIGKKCITIEKHARIAEPLCIGCSACEKKCPFKAISIINLPTDLSKNCAHRYSANSFKLHRLPVPRLGRVLGLVGINGIGKSTALKVLSGKLKPNLGIFEREPEWTDILRNYRGSELHGYFTKILESKLPVSNKIQYIDKVPRLLKRRFGVERLLVRTVLEAMDARGLKSYYTHRMTLENILDRDLEELSGGELQRLSIALACMQNAAVYIFDEPSSYLDVRQRLTAACEIRKLVTTDDAALTRGAPRSAKGKTTGLGRSYDAFRAALQREQEQNSEKSEKSEAQQSNEASESGSPEPASRGTESAESGESREKTQCKAQYTAAAVDSLAAAADTSLTPNNRYVLVVEHDLAILDLMCDYGCVLYGKSGAYGVITAPQSIKAAVNIFLDGFIPTENMRFRDYALRFSLPEQDEGRTSGAAQFQYPALTKTYTGFRLAVTAGSFATSEIVVLLGENGMGKSQMIGMIAGVVPSDEGTAFSGHSVSLKPQKIVPKYKGSVRGLFSARIPTAFQDEAFYADVIRPLGVEYLLDQPVASLSGGELQRVAIIVCLGTEADIYLLDEPSAFLDSEQRLSVAKIIKKHIYGKKKTAFVVEHDLIVGTYLADRVVVFDGEPGRQSTASAPLTLEEGMNRFLSSLDVTFRRDPENYRPRVNKPESAKDREQKQAGKYFFV